MGSRTVRCEMRNVNYNTFNKAHHSSPLSDLSEMFRYVAGVNVYPSCNFRWWAGPWQHCSISCGVGGSRHRTVLCVRSLGPEEQMALEEKDCESLPKPIAQQPCKHKPPPCPSLWKTGPWSEVRDGRNYFYLLT